MSIVHASSHFYIDDKFWDDLKMRLLMVVVSLHFFPTFPTTKWSTIHPPRWLQHSTSAAPRWTSPGAAAQTPSCSPRWASRCARGPGAALRPPGRRRSGSASAKAPRACSTFASLSRGSPREPKSSHGFRRENSFWLFGFMDPNIFWAVATGYTDWCCLMLVVNTVAYCNLQLSLCGFAAFLDANVRWQDNTVLDSTIRVCKNLQCVDLWDPHRVSAKSAKRCSGPNLSAVASARHRSLGPWWCLSHGCAYHMATRWSTMSPTWKTNQVQENGQRYAKSSRCGTAPGFSQTTGLQSMVPALRDLQPYVFTREGGGGQVFWNWQTFVLNGAGNSSQLIA